jgi:hypothetical protein
VRLRACSRGGGEGGGRGLHKQQCAGIFKVLGPRGQVGAGLSANPPPLPHKQNSAVTAALNRAEQVKG